jgi:uncharacterized protein YndB with AHSA1/START domain
MPHPFELRKEFELDTSPEQVWEAIATGPGMDSWFMGRNEIEPREGGRTSLSLAGFSEGSTITAWDPPRRFAHRGDASPDGTFMAFEWLVEGRDGGSTVVRLVQSGMLGDDWEAEYDALSEGWPMYLHSLAEYLTHFAGRVATPVFAARPGTGPDPWAAYTAALGLPDAVAAGDAVRLTPAGLPPIDGVVDYRSAHFLGVRDTDGLYRFIHGLKDTAVLGHHLFAPGTDQRQAEAGWRAWLDSVFP